MDERRFDALVASMATNGLPRRAALRGAIGGGLGLALGGLAIAETGARKKGKKKKKDRCPPGTRKCTINTSGRCCATSCCLFILEPPGGQTFCRFADEVCCSAQDGGGSCGPDYPYCCGPTDEDPEGFCGEYPEDCDLERGRAGVGRIIGRAPRRGAW
jgi:hypothetical protein